MNVSNRSKRESVILRPARLVLALVVGLGSALVQARDIGNAPPGVAIATAHPLATRAGLQVLAQGGNAFDAAVAVSAALAVAEPYSSGLGGGGFYLLKPAGKPAVMLDARETAPQAINVGLYLDDQGKLVPTRSITGPLAAGIPGIPAALDHLARNYGKLPLGLTLQPAIDYARKGIAVGEIYRRYARFRLADLRKDPYTAHTFLQFNDVPGKDFRLFQPQLAFTLSRLAEQGAASFYRGANARRMVYNIRRAGGVWNLSDLAEYRVIERKPIEFRLGEGKNAALVTSASPPSSGGVALATMLKVYLAAGGKAQPIEPHLLIEAMQRAYRDRAEYLGDPDTNPAPVKRLISDAYARQLASTIKPDHATASSELKPAVVIDEGPHTTHFSILDAAGNRVSATLSINYPFGAAMVLPGTGVLLNDEMDDFSIVSGVANAYGLIGAEANALAPGKRMLSSMSPTFIDTPDATVLLGTPGGSRIITMVALGTLDFLGGGNATSMVTQKRFHHQYLPDRVEFEEGAFSAAERRRLGKLGYSFKRIDSGNYGNMQAVIWRKTDAQGSVEQGRDSHEGPGLEAASDPRGEGLAVTCAVEQLQACWQAIKLP